LTVRKTKYGNRKTDGYDSAREASFAKRLEQLRLAADHRERVAEIERQVRFTLIPAQRGPDGKLIERKCDYVADFRVRYADGRTEVIDVKGCKTPDYIIKRKLMLHVHGIAVREV
jgi:hypothetical protein